MMTKAILTLAVLTLTSIPAFANEVGMVPTKSFEPIRAEITNPDPKEFTINVKFLANTFANTDAPIFSVYTSSSRPEKCADFRHLELSYQKPSKYERRFDLSTHPEVIDAVNQYKCVVIPNVPSS